ncbi:MAG: putative nucleotidyltransferase component of viral defense system [Gammaproteobacteria bacterium]|jgi:predicted nucleotidyltransferase component of viral defense system
MTNLREQFIERLIREFFLKKGGGFVLKSGAAVRTLFGQQRLTKDVDLDFTNPKGTADSLHNTVQRAITATALALSLRDLKVSKPGRAERSPRWKINFSDPDGQPCRVEVEVSRDPARAVPGMVVQKPFAPSAAKGIARFWVDIYDEPALIATKLAALLGREAPRDIYDLDLLMTTSAWPSPEQIQWAIDRANLNGQDAEQMLGTRLEALSWDRYQSELRDALPADVADRIDVREWQAMKQRVEKYVKHLLHENAG